MSAVVVRRASASSVAGESCAAARLPLAGASLGPRCCQPSFSQLRKTPGGGDGGRNFGNGWHCRSSPTQNEEPATLQTPQGFDATHGGELFPIDESRLTSTQLAVA